MQVVHPLFKGTVHQASLHTALKDLVEMHNGDYKRHKFADTTCTLSLYKKPLQLQG